MTRNEKANVTRITKNNTACKWLHILQV